MSHSRSSALPRCVGSALFAVTLLGCSDGGSNNSLPGRGSTVPADPSSVDTVLMVPESVQPGSQVSEVVADTVLVEPDGEPVGSNPLAPPSRRTDIDDVDLLAGLGRELPDGYGRAAVPVDAWAARLLVVDKSDQELEDEKAGLQIGADETVITAQISSCELVSVWALPHPDEVVVGFEEYPSLTCVRAFGYVVFFVVPVSGVNSEGEWAYPNGTSEFSVPVRTQVRVGPTD